MISDLRFTDEVAIKWADSYTGVLEAAQNNAFDDSLFLLHPQVERLYTYFSLAIESSTRTIDEWESLGYTRASLTVFVALSVEAGHLAKFNSDGTFTQTF